VEVARAPETPSEKELRTLCVWREKPFLRGAVLYAKARYVNFGFP
jgi:hypothetical protein